jgi:formamidopyrimidine-DNA glycosylase
VPELPEVETIRRGLLPHLEGRRILKLTVRDTRLRWPVEADLAEQLVGRRILRLDRRGKYLLLALDNGDRLMVHLGMSGRLRIYTEAPPPPGRHDHLDWELEGSRWLRFHDPRRFGAVLRWAAEAPGHVLIDHLGPEPFDPAFNADYLFARSRGRRSALKAFLMDGETVVGCGNIYAAEALFRAGLRPGRAAGSVSRANYQRLVEAVHAVLDAAITQGGTTLRDFAGASGEAGYFQQDLYVYSREGQPCRVCATPIQSRRIGQRASGYCPRCQR